MDSKKQTIYARILYASRAFKGVRLTHYECKMLCRDDAFLTRATLDLDFDEHDRNPWENPE